VVAAFSGAAPVAVRAPNFALANLAPERLHAPGVIDAAADRRSLESNVVEFEHGDIDLLAVRAAAPSELA